MQKINDFFKATWLRTQQGVPSSYHTLDFGYCGFSADNKEELTEITEIIDTSTSPTMTKGMSVYFDKKTFFPKSILKGSDIVKRTIKADKGDVVVVDFDPSETKHYLLGRLFERPVGRPIFVSDEDINRIGITSLITLLRNTISSKPAIAFKISNVNSFNTFLKYPSKCVSVLEFSKFYWGELPTPTPDEENLLLSYAKATDESTKNTGISLSYMYNIRDIYLPFMMALSNQRPSNKFRNSIVYKHLMRLLDLRYRDLQTCQWWISSVDSVCHKVYKSGLSDPKKLLSQWKQALLDHYGDSAPKEEDWFENHVLQGYGITIQK